MELFRDQAADLFEAHIGIAWKPRTGSCANHHNLTATVIDNREFIAAQRRAEIEPLIPKRAKIAFAGGVDCNEHRAIWDALDPVLAKHTDMVLMRGGSSKGASHHAGPMRAKSRRWSSDRTG